MCHRSIAHSGGGGKVLAEADTDTRLVVGIVAGGGGVVEVRPLNDGEHSLLLIPRPARRVPSAQPTLLGAARIEAHYLFQAARSQLTLA